VFSDRFEVLTLLRVPTYVCVGGGGEILGNNVVILALPSLSLTLLQDESIPPEAAQVFVHLYKSFTDSFD